MNGIQSSAFNQNSILLVILIGGVVFASEKCTDIVQTSFGGGKWFNLFELNGILGETMQVEVSALVASAIRDSSVRLVLVAGHENSAQQIAKHYPIQYRLICPVAIPLAEIIEIKLNGRLICGEELDASKNPSSNQKFLHLWHSFTPLVNAQINEEPSTNKPEQIENMGNKSDSELCGRVADRYNVKPLVVGGIAVARGSWPWLVAIFTNTDNMLSFQCPGTLISSRSIISAARCFTSRFQDYKAEEITIGLGRYNIMKPAESGTIMTAPIDIHIHPDHNPKNINEGANFAIIRTEFPIPYTDLIRPACIWQRPEDITSIEGQKIMTVGWGSNDKLMSTPAKLQVEIVSNEACLRSNMAFQSLISKWNFCAGDRNGKGPCRGDSGSGLLLPINNQWTLRGIVSYVRISKYDTCILEEYFVYSDIAKVMDWIKQLL